MAAWVPHMTRGGRRPGAGRPPILTNEEVARIGRACERIWYWESGPRRPYYLKPYVLDWASKFYSAQLRKPITTRRIEYAWKAARRAQLGRAQPRELAYEDARDFEEYLERKIEELNDWDWWGNYRFSTED